MHLACPFLVNAVGPDINLIIYFQPNVCFFFLFFFTLNICMVLGSCLFIIRC